MPDRMTPEDWEAQRGYADQHPVDTVRMEALDRLGDHITAARAEVRASRERAGLSPEEIATLERADATGEAYRAERTERIRTVPDLNDVLTGPMQGPVTPVGVPGPGEQICGGCGAREAGEHAPDCDRRPVVGIDPAHSGVVYISGPEAPQLDIAEIRRVMEEQMEPETEAAGEEFRTALAHAINCASWDSRVNMHDFVLAKMMHDLLLGLETAQREERRLSGE